MQIHHLAACAAAFLAAAPALAQDQFLGPAPWIDPQAAATWQSFAAPVVAPKAVSTMGPINTASKLAVRSAYNAYYAPAMPAMGFTGSVAGCTAGTISTAFKEWTLTRVNYFRAMAGLPGNIALDTNAQRENEQQSAAVVFSANQNLSHSPATDPAFTLCTSLLSSADTAAGNSNIGLAFGSPSFDDVVIRYIDDSGVGNEAVGHRRWILYPPQASMTVGSTPTSASTWGGNALRVFNAFGSRPATPNGVAWPPRGYVPMAVLPGSSRWSYSFDGASFAGATVSMTANGSPVSVSVISTTIGYGDNTIVFVPSTTIVKDVAYAVTVSGITGGTFTSLSYTVRPFDPADPIGGSPGDQNLDGNSDLLWRNGADGSAQAWLMNGLAATTVTGLLPAGGYNITHRADLDGDGRSDILIRAADGSVIGWLMNGTSVVGSATLLPAGSGWSVVKTGDLNGDGKADLLLQHTDGTVQAWLMNGLAVTSTATLVGAGSGWSIAQVADLNGDGRADIVWQNANGAVQAWLMNGTSVTSIASFAPAGSGWTPVLAADLNGDGTADLVWQHTDGSTQGWLMNGLSAISLASFSPAGSGWSPKLAGDIDGDGKADIFWQHTNGASQTWIMNGLAAAQLATFVPASTGWAATQLLDLNGDGRQDVIWSHSGGAVQAWLMNGLTVSQVASLAPAGSYAVVP